jgi:hypothetical protein
MQDNYFSTNCQSNKVPLPSLPSPSINFQCHKCIKLQEEWVEPGYESQYCLSSEAAPPGLLKLTPQNEIS